MGNFHDILNVILPPSNMKGMNVNAGILHKFGEVRSATRRHYGIDFNYHYRDGKRVGQGGINKQYPILYSPVSGIVDKINPEWGQVGVKDETKGYIHQILHMKVYSWKEFKEVEEGQHIKIGQAIGRMGNTSKTIKNGDYHGHYQIEVPKLKFDKTRLISEPNKYKESQLKGHQIYIDPEMFEYTEFKSAFPPGHFEKTILIENPYTVMNTLRSDIFGYNPFFSRLDLDLTDNDRIPDYLKVKK